MDSGLAQSQINNSSRRLMRHLQRFLSRTWEHSKRNNVSSCPFCELCPPAAILALSLVLLMNLTEDLWISQPLFYILLSVALLIMASTWPGTLFPPQLKHAGNALLDVASGESSRRFQIQWSWQRGLIIASSFSVSHFCVSAAQYVAQAADLPDTSYFLLKESCCLMCVVWKPLEISGIGRE